MPRLPFAWIVWLILIAIAANVASAFPGHSSPSQNATFIATQPALDDSPPGEAISVTREGERSFWGLEQQSNHILAAVRAHALVFLLSQREDLLRAAPTPVLPPVRIWFPRKLSPPSAQDDPFLK